MESQIIELLGRNRLIDELLRAGLEVALPIRDRGIDLIAYADLGPRIMQFSAVPIQMKACSECTFSLDAKYAKFPNLLIAHIWHIDSPQDEVTFAMKYDEALVIADAMGWTKTASWKKGYYTNTHPGSKLRDLLEQHRMNAEKWRQKVLGAVHTVD
ncbi:MAG: hypothetical protein L0229_12040 [Blastocatellia bacterium]|nr:hypothetical protein [Blastocatellia bacterium]